MNREEKIKKAIIEIMRKKFKDFKHGRKFERTDFEAFGLNGNEITSIMLILEFISNIRPEALMLIDELIDKKLKGPDDLAELTIDKIGISKIIDFQIKKFMKEAMKGQR